MPSKPVRGRHPADHGAAPAAGDAAARAADHGVTGASHQSCDRAAGAAAARTRTGRTVAGLASIAAGIIHAVAAGAHSEHRPTMIAFAACAAFQVGWGAWALVRSGRLLPLVGAAGNAAAVGGWVLAKTNGIGFIDGLDSPRPTGITRSAMRRGGTSTTSTARRSTTSTGLDHLRTGEQR